MSTVATKMPRQSAKATQGISADGAKTNARQIQILNRLRSWKGCSSKRSNNDRVTPGQSGSALPSLVSPLYPVICGGLRLRAGIGGPFNSVNRICEVGHLGVSGPLHIEQHPGVVCPRFQ